MERKTFTSFNVLKVPLAGSNLIEASAGTGKTYSIAIMVLRLVIENRIPVKEILMVTYTKAAVAELEERIRLFIRLAEKVSRGEQVNDGTITEIVTTAIKQYGEEVHQRLKDAVLLLDETAVLTIHSFCQQALSEFALETGQLFSPEILEDVDAAIEGEVNKFWREYITTLKLDLLDLLITNKFSRKNLIGFIKKHAAGQRYLFYDDAKESYCLPEEEQEELVARLKTLEEREKILTDSVVEYIQTHSKRLMEKASKNSNAKKKLHLIEDPVLLIRALFDEKLPQYMKAIFDDVLELCEPLNALIEERNGVKESIVQQLHCHAIQVVSRSLEKYKQRFNLLAFDDMIVHLHRSVVGETNHNLVIALRKKYRAVFVDEFQDTDKLQYEIFQHIYTGAANILFYIGDPKQSIYAWRKADIFTYFKAANEVQNTYSMNINYRSSPNYIGAMNLFFKPEAHFDTFCFAGQAHEIHYTLVAAPEGTKKGELQYRDMDEPPISVFDNTKNEEIVKTVTAQVIRLLSDNGYSITQKGVKRSVRPSDIGILVRKNRQAADIKQGLAMRGIPAVTIDETKILESEEARHVLFLLEALVTTNRATINKALLSPFTDYTLESILFINEEEVLNRFKQYKTIWDEDGVYSVLLKFIRDYRVRSVLLNSNRWNGERAIANLTQVIEILHKVQSQKQFSAAELLSWLKRGVEGLETEGDEFEQRVESDEEAVKIVTIHKSKGLEYNIVFAPFLDFLNKPAGELSSLRHPVSGDYLFGNGKQFNDEQLAWFKEQADQENRRLMYVAITRAVYKCYINSSKQFKESSLKPFLHVLQKARHTLINFPETPEADPSFFFKNTNRYTPGRPRQAHFHLQQLNWRKLSYTALAAQHAVEPKSNLSAYQQGYDFFIFKQLSRGARTGNLLHSIFENIDFTNPSYWDYNIKQALRQHLPRLAEEYLPMLRHLVKQVIGAVITTPHGSFSLAGVPASKRLNELEFDFNVPPFNPSEIIELETPERRISLKTHAAAEGLMNGKIDMLFQHDGRYYVLDWKSNFLGDSLHYYQPALLNNALSENNYHLQYLLYTIAAKKFLASRLPGFNYHLHFGGVIYLFVRGLRAGENSGVFTYIPPENVIDTLEAIIGTYNKVGAE